MSGSRVLLCIDKVACDFPPSLLDPWSDPESREHDTNSQIPRIPNVDNVVDHLDRPPRSDACGPFWFEWLNIRDSALFRRHPMAITSCRKSDYEILSERYVLAPGQSDEIEQNWHGWKLFNIWRNLHCLALLLELAALKPEIGYSILVDPDRSKRLAGTQETGPVSHLNSFEFSFHCRKQVEVTGRQVRWIGWTSVSCDGCRVFEEKYLLQKSVERNKYICYKIGVIHFDIIWESVDSIEAARIPS
jgi:hypothetical protein